MKTSLQTCHGFIAQEVGLTLDNLNVESNIRLKPKENEIQSVNYEAIIAPLVTALQELKCKITTLQKKIAILKNEIT